MNTIAFAVTIVKFLTSTAKSTDIAQRIMDTTRLPNPQPRKTKQMNHEETLMTISRLIKNTDIEAIRQKLNSMEEWIATNYDNSGLSIERKTQTK
jgi:hypothetical protein